MPVENNKQTKTRSVKAIILFTLPWCDTLFQMGLTTTICVKIATVNNSGSKYLKKAIKPTRLPIPISSILNAKYKELYLIAKK